MRMLVELRPGELLATDEPPARWPALHEWVHQQDRARGARVELHQVLRCRFQAERSEFNKSPETLLRDGFGDCDDFLRALRLALWWLPSRAIFERLTATAWHTFPEFWIANRWRALDISGFSQVAQQAPELLGAIVERDPAGRTAQGCGCAAPGPVQLGQVVDKPLGPFQNGRDAAIAAMKGQAFGIEPWVLFALVEAESSGDQLSASSCCCGLLQINPGKGQALEAFNATMRAAREEAGETWTDWTKEDICSGTLESSEKNLIVGIWHLSNVVKALADAGAIRSWDEQGLVRLFIAWNAGWSAERGFLHLWDAVVNARTGDGTLDKLVQDGKELAKKTPGGNVLARLYRWLNDKPDLNTQLERAALQMTTLVGHLKEAKRWRWAEKAARRAVSVYKPWWEGSGQATDWQTLKEIGDREMAQQGGGGGGGGALLLLALLFAAGQR